MTAPLPVTRSTYSRPIFTPRSDESQNAQMSTSRRQQRSPSPSHGRSNGAKDATRARAGLRLTDAFAATAGSRNGDEDESSVLLTGNGELSPQKPLRSATRRPYQSRLPRSRNRDGGSSPNYTPSPTRGLRDAYQKVVEAEDRDKRTSESLDARQDYKRISREFSDKDPLRGKVFGKMDATARSDSPASFTRTRKSTPSPEIDVEDQHVGDDNHFKREIGARSESGSDASGFSFLKDVTNDSFNRELKRHAKDQERVKGALSDVKGIFSRTSDHDAQNSRPGKQSSVPAPVNSRRNWMRGRDRTSSGDSESIRSEGSDPQIQISAPRTWGSKARGKKDWMNKIRSKHEEPTPSANESKLDGGSVTQEDIDWVSAAADIPIPSVEDTPVNLPSDTNLQKLQREVDPLDKIPSWEDDEFTGRSLQVSTSPRYKIRRDVAPDRNREREIASLRDRAVTTNRLGEIHQRASMDSLKSQKEEGLRPASPDVDVGQAGPLPAVGHHLNVGRRRGSDISRAMKPIIGDEQAQVPPETPLPVTKRSSSDKLSKANLTKDELENPRPISTISAKRPEVFRGDSRELLRELARATSNSPPSVPTELLALDNGIPMKSEKPQGSETKEAAQPVPQTPAVASSMSKGSGLTNAKTPQVMGGWIDTPAPTQRVKTEEGAKTQPQQRQAAKPRFLGIRDYLRGSRSSVVMPPPSNLSQTTNAQSSDQQKSQPSKVDEDLTLDSIQEMLLNDATLTSMSDRELFDAANAKFDSKGQSISDTQRARMMEAYNSQKLTKHLRKVQSSIHSSKRGIEGLQHILEDGFEAPSSSGLGGQLRNFSLRPFSLFITRDSRLTLLSWILIVWLTVYSVESLACINYCHETYMLGSGNEDVNAPIWGWATLYVLQKLVPPIFGPLVFGLKFITGRLDLLLDVVLDLLDLPSSVLDFGEGSGYGAKHQHMWDLYYIELRRRRRGR